MQADVIRLIVGETFFLRDCKPFSQFRTNLLLLVRPWALKSPVEFHRLVRLTPGEALWLLEVELFRDLGQAYASYDYSATGMEARLQS